MRMIDLKAKTNLIYVSKTAFDQMQRIPTVDAEVVVRRKYCRRCDGFPESDNIMPNEVGVCKLDMLMVKPDDFCSYGERKDGDGWWS